ncbi:MAG TPA: hypothetical protein VEK37_08865 [Gemmatimonadaceae bacterium]|nr:hypothetical protein [Gemmatimonadaceae bacterium]
MHRIIRALLIILALNACGPLQTRPTPRISTDVGLATTGPSVAALTSDEPASQGSVFDAGAEIANGPRTERAIGVVGLAAEVAALTIFFIGFYKLAKLLH